MSADAKQKPDVYFLFGEGQRIPAHRNVLVRYSAVFKSMFSAAKPGGTQNFNVKGITKAVFKEFLRFFYRNGPVKKSMDNVSDLLHLGHKYEVAECISDCIAFLMKNIVPTNVCSVLRLAVFYAHAKLVKECTIFIILHTEAVFKSADFLNCDESVLARILKLDKLTCSEIDVFKACMSWVSAASEQSESTLTKKDVKLYLGDLFYEIRFAAMEYDEFCKLATEYRAILWSELPTITNLIAKSGDWGSKFNKLPRHFEWNELATVKCDRVECKSGFEGNFQFDDVEEIVFLSNKPLILGSLTFCEISSARVDIKIAITETELCKGSVATVLLEEPGKLQSNGTVVLLHTILIRPGFCYTITIEKCSLCQVFYSNELKTKIALDSDTIVEFHNYSSCKETGKVIGLISALGFNRI